ncbi:MAG: dihydroneopterin aldolase [Nannocystaceae bacterium]|nr:dihydroneopterin aldolase [Nannocystaceae bacterium]
MNGDSIEIQGMKLDCIVGVRPEERDREQGIVVDLSLGLDLREAGRSSRIAETVDYDLATDQIAALLRFRRYWLIENAAEEVAAMLFGVYPKLSTVEVRIAKPGALLGRASAAAVCISRQRNDFTRGSESTPWGGVEILLETRHAGLYLLHVDAGKEIPRHHHKVMRELEWLVSGELLQASNPVAFGQPVVWARGKAHSYRNATEKRATLFCCDFPPFIPSDEIEEHA